MRPDSRIFIIFTLFPLLAGAAIDWSGYDLSDENLFKQDHIAVKLDDGTDLDMIEGLLNDLGATVVRRIEQINVLEIRLAENMSAPDAIGYFEAFGGVKYAEPIVMCQVYWTPDDPQFEDQWSFDSNHLNMPLAWDRNRGSSQVIVAIVDSGIAYEDNDIPAYETDEVITLDGTYQMCPDFTASQFVPGYDVVHDDDHPNDQNGHGTHVGGTVAQATNNGVGVAGMAPNCKLMPIQVMNYLGSGEDVTIADGITWAADHGAHVINLSLGVLIPGVPAPIQYEAIQYAVEKDVVVVAAAGNLFGWPELSYPAAYEECIAVGATDYNDLRAPYSQYGEGLDISAPGGNTDADEDSDGNPDGIVQPTFTQMGDPFTEQKATVNEFEYRFLNGTSMATPHVSGLAALLISHGITGVEAVKNAIYNTARDLGDSGYDIEYGHGIIDPVEALSLPSVAEKIDFENNLQLSTVSSNGSSEISYVLPEDTRVVLNVWDASGRLVKTLAKEYQAEGSYTIEWNGTDQSGYLTPQGVYFVKLSTDNFQISEKVIFVK